MMVVIQSVLALGRQQDITRRHGRSQIPEMLRIGGKPRGVFCFSFEVKKFSLNSLQAPSPTMVTDKIA